MCYLSEYYVWEPDKKKNLDKLCVQPHSEER